MELSFTANDFDRGKWKGTECCSFIEIKCPCREECVRREGIPRISMQSGS